MASARWRVAKPVEGVRAVGLSTPGVMERAAESFATTTSSRCFVFACLADFRRPPILSMPPTREGSQTAPLKW